MLIKHLDDDAAMVLTELRAAGLQTAVCSNWDWDLEEAIAAAGQLNGYYLLHATRADLLRRLGRFDEAAGSAHRLQRRRQSI